MPAGDAHVGQRLGSSWDTTDGMSKVLMMRLSDVIILMLLGKGRMVFLLRLGLGKDCSISVTFVY